MEFHVDFRTMTQRAAAWRRQSFGSGKKSVLQQYMPHVLMTRKRVRSHREEDYTVGYSQANYRWKSWPAGSAQWDAYLILLLSKLAVIHVCKEQLFKTFSSIKMNCMFRSHRSDFIWATHKRLSKMSILQGLTKRDKVYQGNYISNVKDFQSII